MRDWTVLLVEDDATIREGLVDALQSEGYRVLAAPDGPKGLALGLASDPDLVVLDLMLPGMDGFEVLRRLRADAVETPVLVLTARGLEADKVKGFQLGADDYLVKPFGLAEFLARVKSRLRVWGRERGLDRRAELRIGDCTIDLVGRAVRRGSNHERLTAKEAELLSHFVDREGRVLGRAAILDAVWANDGEVTSRVVDNAVLQLRKKIEPEPSRPRFFLSVRGVGYRFSRVTHA